MPIWFLSLIALLFAAHTALTVGCLTWLWREYHPRASAPARRPAVARLVTDHTAWHDAPLETVWAGIVRPPLNPPQEH